MITRAIPGDFFDVEVRSMNRESDCVLSLLLQHGVPSAQIASSMGRSGSAEPASIIGAVIDLAAKATQGSESTETGS